MVAVAVSLLPPHLAQHFAKIEPYGFMILVLLLMTGILGAMIGPFIAITIQLVAWVFGFEV